MLKYTETYKSKWWEDGWKALVYSHIRSSGWVLPINFKVRGGKGALCCIEMGPGKIQDLCV